MGRGSVVDEEVVVEAADIEEDTFVVEEEFGEEGEVLREQLVLLAVELEDGVVRVGVDHFAGRVGVFVFA